MITWAENGGLKENDLAQLSYTLLKGRHHFNHRAAIVVQDADDAVYVWKQAKLNEHHPYVFSGKVPQRLCRASAYSGAHDRSARQVRRLIF
ncbi:hypothetical protein QNN00_13100 [Bacillus velezensis]|nr:hypothetical protein [Bacillus velezensis]